MSPSTEILPVLRPRKLHLVRLLRLIHRSHHGERHFLLKRLLRGLVVPLVALWLLSRVDVDMDVFIRGICLCISRGLVKRPVVESSLSQRTPTDRRSSMEMVMRVMRPFNLSPRQTRQKLSEMDSSLVGCRWMRMPRVPVKAEASAEDTTINTRSPTTFSPLWSPADPNPSQTSNPPSQNLPGPHSPPFLNQAHSHTPHPPSLLLSRLSPNHHDAPTRRSTHPARGHAVISKTCRPGRSRLSYLV